MKKTDLAIVNRSFWPKSQVIGEGLLQFAEKTAEQHSVCVITQAEGDLSELLTSQGRGRGVHIRACKAYTTSKSSLIMRLVESIYFMFWTFISLIRVKPANVYVSTNPPVVVPFIVALYCRLFKASYVYHLQDIHPEAANIVIPFNRFIYSILKKVDNYTLRHAKSIITLSDDMKSYIQQRSDTTSPIFLLDNPSFKITPIPMEERTKDVIFCGNAGRLQLIPLLTAAIEGYIKNGGKLCFTFAGGGIYLPEIKALADKYHQVDYLGFIPALEAADLIRHHRWALLPIDDEVTKYAFPSKSSGYALSGSAILAICGINSSVARWVQKHQVGIVCEPEQLALVECFFSLEKNEINDFTLDAAFRGRLKISHFAEKLQSLSLSN